ncbi:tRNA-dihydrouridine synthase [candidate division SR1 bacterium]|nr:tRNA-dihydrouridine synthase [candidate division SR1 bacterium]
MQLCFAPMDGITNCATRQLTAEVFAKYKSTEDKLILRTEFMNVDGFLRNPDGVIHHLYTTASQKPIAQIYGGNEKTLIEAAVKIEREYGESFSGIELNTGCPSVTVMKCGGGSELMKNKMRTMNIIQNLSQNLTFLPFSIKARIGLNEEDKADQFDFLVQASQYCCKISVHGRTLKQGYSGDVDWEFIGNLKCVVSDRCEVIGNGGILAYDQAIDYGERYKLDGIMIGQAAIGNPRIFTPHQPTNAEKMDVILRHLELYVSSDLLSCSERGKLYPYILLDEIEEQIKIIRKNPDFSSHALVEFRKFLFAYVKGISDSREWKTRMLTASTYGEVRDEIVRFFERIV